MLSLSTNKDIRSFEKLSLPAMKPSVYGVLSESVEKFGSRIALRFFLQGTKYKKSVDYTYSELLANVHAAANMFRYLGIGNKGVVSYLLPNLPETMFTLYGAETAGIVNPINPLLDAEHIVDILNAAGTKILVTLAPFPKTNLWAKAAKIINKVPSLEYVLTIDMGRYLGFFPRKIIGLTQQKPNIKTSVQVLDFNKTIKKFRKDKLSFNRQIKPTDIAAYFHTGGTTGRPKIAQHTHSNEVFNAWILNQHLGLKESKQFFCGLPWFHVNGVIVTGLLPLTGGHTVVLGTPSGYRGEGVIPNFWKIVEHYRISFFSSVPTILQMLLEVPQNNENIASLEYALCGAAPLSVKLFNDFEKSVGVKILEGYGFTEGTCVNSLNPLHGNRKIGSVGMAISHHHMKVVILDENKKYVRDAMVDEIGTIVTRGKNVFPGYKEANHNKSTFIDDGIFCWYNTGDLGRKDADGYYWITGRKKELIIRGGHNIDPKSIEEPLAKHPAVAAAAAVARPDKHVGEMPMAYVQLKPQESATTEDLLSFAKDNIKERAAIPKSIKIIDALPLTAVGKVFKPALVCEQIKEVFEQELNTLDGITTSTVEVIQDEKKGLVAIVKAQAKEGMDIKDSIDNTLGGYTITYELN